LASVRSPVSYPNDWRSNMTRTPGKGSPLPLRTTPVTTAPGGMRNARSVRCSPAAIEIGVPGRPSLRAPYPVVT
jgi:hypothetical protein